MDNNGRMEFELQPELSGSLIHLRPLRVEDFAGLFSAASDPLVWEQHPETDRYKREVFQKFFDSGIESGGALVITDLASGRIIGSSRYYGLNPDEREVRIGYTFLERAFWGGFTNRELKSLMIDHAFRFVDRVLFDVGETNLRSQKALQKIGARLVGKAEFQALDGTMKPHLIFAITR